MDSFFGVDLSSLPWPVALLTLVVIGVSVFIFYVYLPLLDDANRLKKSEEEELRNINDTLSGLTDLIDNSLNNYDFKNYLTTEVSRLREYNENRFDGVTSVINEIIRLNHELTNLFSSFETSFKNELTEEIKDINDFNKEYFLKIVAQLNTIDQTTRELVNDLEKLDNEFKNFIRNNDNISNQSQRNIDTMKDKINNMTTQIDAIKEKISMLAMTLNRP